MKLLKPWFAKILSLSLLMGLWSAPVHSQGKIRVITEDYPPLNYVENSQLKGASVDIVREILKKLYLQTKIDVFPWAHGYNLLETRDNIALFSTTRSKIREDLFKGSARWRSRNSRSTEKPGLASKFKKLTMPRPTKLAFKRTASVNSSSPQRASPC